MKNMTFGVAVAALTVGFMLIVTVPGNGAARAAESDALPQLNGCQACHGTDGISVLPFAPHLAGQRSAYLEGQLKAFRSGDRKSEIMNAIASQLDDGQITGLAAACRVKALRMMWRAGHARWHHPSPSRLLSRQALRFIPARTMSMRAALPVAMQMHWRRKQRVQARKCQMDQ